MPTRLGRQDGAIGPTLESVGIGPASRHIDAMTPRIHRRRDADPIEGLDRYGPTLFADRTNKKYPIDTPGRIKAAWAYIHQPSNAAKYTAAERRTIQGRIRKAAKDRAVALPDPGEFVELMKRVRRRKRSEE
jgi:hypothetical protein